nr:MAG TPA: hypothetical protein [Caudoviricetes sp.]
MPLFLFLKMLYEYRDILQHYKTSLRIIPREV